MNPKSQPSTNAPTRSAESTGHPLSTWINVVLSFVFVCFGVIAVLWAAFWAFGRERVAEEAIPAVGWSILAVGIALGLFNAVRYFRRVKERAT